MGKVDHLRIRVEPFAGVLSPRHCTALYVPTPEPALNLNLHHRKQKMSLYGHSWFNSQQTRVAPPPLSYLGMLFIHARNLNPLIYSTSGVKQEMKF